MNIKTIVDADKFNADGSAKITRGPALVIANGVTRPDAPDVIHTEEALSLNTNAESSKSASAAVGVVGRQSKTERLEMKVKPIGFWGNLATWFPMLSMQGGDLLLPVDNGSPLDVLCITSLKVFRFWRSGVIKMSALKGGPGVSLMEELTLGIGRKVGVGFGDANSLQQVFDLTKATITPSYGAAAAASSVAFNATAAQWQTCLNSIAGFGTGEGSDGVTVRNSYRDGGLIVTWSSKGARADEFTAMLAGFPSNATLTETVMTEGDANTREVRLLRVNPYMAAFTAALTPTPKRNFLLSYLSQAIWKPSWNGTEGTERPCNVTAAVLQADLRTLCGDANLKVDGSMREGWIVTRTAGAVAHALTAAITNAPPGTYLKVRIITPGAAAVGETPAVAQVEVLKLAPWAGFGQFKEFAVDFKENVKPVAPSGMGTDNWEFGGLETQVKVEPDAMLLEDAIAGAALQGDSTAEMGSELGDLAQCLEMIAQDVYIAIPNACFSRELQAQWGLDKQHIGALTFDGIRKVDSNGLLPPFVVLGTTAPA